MPNLPAFCDNCEAIFDSGFLAENSLNISFINCKSGPCPNCGSMGHIPDGVYNIIGKTIELLTGPQRTVYELTKLAYLIKKAQKDHPSPEVFSNIIDREIPELSSIKGILPKTRAELYQFLIIILMLINIIISSTNNLIGRKNGLTKSEIEQLIHHSIEKSCKKTDIVMTSPTKEFAQKKNKIGRNEPCPCGSGKKYKKCHGKVK